MGSLKGLFERGVVHREGRRSNENGFFERDVVFNAFEGEHETQKAVSRGIYGGRDVVSRSHFRERC